ncbi:hypothetical protein BT69DRAFT_733880 [Atractiella rhizophila]|nr:hypothetical protein BT69DRAFT_733880 [Atractiella rhizophila]
MKFICKRCKERRLPCIQQKLVIGCINCLETKEQCEFSYRPILRRHEQGVRTNKLKSSYMNSSDLAKDIKLQLSGKPRKRQKRNLPKKQPSVASRGENLDQIYVGALKLGTSTANGRLEVKERKRSLSSHLFNLSQLDSVTKVFLFDPLLGISSKAFASCDDFQRNPSTLGGYANILLSWCFALAARTSSHPDILGGSHPASISIPEATDCSSDDYRSFSRLRQNAVLALITHAVDAALEYGSPLYRPSEKSVLVLLNIALAFTSDVRNSKLRTNLGDVLRLSLHHFNVLWEVAPSTSERQRLTDRYLEYIIMVDNNWQLYGGSGPMLNLSHYMKYHPNSEWKFFVSPAAFRIANVPMDGSMKSVDLSWRCLEAIFRNLGLVGKAIEDGNERQLEALLLEVEEALCYFASWRKNAVKAEFNFTSPKEHSLYTYRSTGKAEGIVSSRVITNSYFKCALCLLTRLSGAKQRFPDNMIVAQMQCRAMTSRGKLLDDLLRYTAANIAIKRLSHEVTYYSQSYELAAFNHLFRWPEGIKALVSHATKNIRIQGHVALIVEQMKFLSWKSSHISQALDDLDDEVMRATSDNVERTEDFYEERPIYIDVAAKPPSASPRLDDFRKTLQILTLGGADQNRSPAPSLDEFENTLQLLVSSGVEEYAFP